MTSLRDDLDELPISRLSPNGRRPSPWVSLGSYGAIIGVITFLFGLGFAWRGIVDTKEAQEALATSLKSEYVRKDVYASDIAGMRNKLEEISAQLADLQRRARLP